MRIGIIESRRSVGIRSNLVLYSKMNDTSADAVVLDETGTHSGVILGNVTKGGVGKLGTSLIFGGGAVAYPNSDEFQQFRNGSNISLSANFWVNFSTVRDTWLIAKRRLGTFGWQIRYSNGQWIIEFQNTDTTAFSCTKNLTAIANTWYNVGFSFDPSQQTIELYMNGVDQLGTVTGTVKTLAENTDSLWLGRFSGNTSFDLLGRMDELKLYQGRALTSEDHTKFYNNGNGLEI